MWSSIATVRIYMYCSVLPQHRDIYTASVIERLGHAMANPHENSLDNSGEYSILLMVFTVGGNGLDQTVLYHS